MKQKGYDAKTKAAIIEAVNNARKAGKNWKEAHLAAKKAGCKGNLRNLLKMLYKAGAKTKKRRGRKALPYSVAVIIPKIKRGPGRPPKAAGVAGIEALVDQAVRARICGALERAIAILEEARAK